ncbi:MAG: VOC family protein [Asticcacaulis sp.]
MRSANPYLYFNGNCREAMSFYRSVFGVEGDFTTFADMPPDVQPQGADPEGVMHCELHVPGFVLMAADVPPGAAWAQGRSFRLSLSCESREEMDRLFAALGEGGVVDAAPYDAFWGDRTGLLTDRFGVGWMLSFR